MAKEYIEREDVWQKIFNHCEVCVKLHNAADCNDCILDELKDELYEIPAADVRPVVRGRWKRVDPRSTVVTFRCSECDYYAHMNATNFCPNCGADCRGDANGE